MKFMDVRSLKVLADAVTYSVMAFTAIRRAHLGPLGGVECTRAPATFHMFAEPRCALTQSRISNLRFGPNTVSRHSSIILVVL
jgi:hypothetical protein